MTYQRADGTRVLIVGELNIDMVVSGLNSLPILGQEILAETCRAVLGSSSAICAAGMARLGAEVDYIGKIGDDDRGRFVRRELDRLGVGTDHLIVDPDVATGITISLTFPADRAMVTYLGSISALTYREIDMSLLQGGRHLHVGSYYLQRALQPQMSELFTEAHEAGLTISLDTGCDPENQWRDGRILDLLRLVDVFLPNELEACAIAGTERVDDAARQLADLGPLVVVKRGAEGAMAVSADGYVVQSTGFVVDAVDTTGAGDSFDAGCIYAYVLRQLPLDVALRMANACGALSTQGYGGTAAQATPEMLERFLREHGEN